MYHYIVSWVTNPRGKQEQKYTSWDKAFEHFMFLANGAIELYRNSGGIVPWREVTIEAIKVEDESSKGHRLV
jgi:hypothetical protein